MDNQEILEIKYQYYLNDDIDIVERNDDMFYLISNLIEPDFIFDFMEHDKFSDLHPSLRMSFVICIDSKYGLNKEAMEIRDAIFKEINTKK